MHPASGRGLRACLIASVALAAATTTTALRAHDDDRDRDRHERHGHDDARIKRGFEVVPKGVKLNLAGRNRAAVGLGSYLVNAVGGCNDCHTHPGYAPGGNPFLGQPEMIEPSVYMAGGRTFGPFTSANITPDANGRPHGLSRSEFIQTMRTGHNPQDPPGQLLQVMPWPVYGKMIDRDLSAIYEYLRAIPQLPDNPNPGPEP